ncbi:hypothetical protein B0H14DRAFT_2560587 [Mycena olivaceomarginata]|nr:hypothetical protein B0H14DRAFT_2560587 [Mycena olivaceomarginata]
MSGENKMSATGICSADQGSHLVVEQISRMLRKYNKDKTSDHMVFTQLSEVVMFEIQVVSTMDSEAHFEGGGKKTKLKPPGLLTYPKIIYMDQFLDKNLDIMNELRLAQTNDMDGRDDRKPGEAIKSELLKELQEVSNQVSLQRRPYNLCALIADNTNLPGQTHMYSYVQDKGGGGGGGGAVEVGESSVHSALRVITDQTPNNQVPENDDLSDPKNLRPNSGVYVLMYSRCCQDAVDNTFPTSTLMLKANLAHRISRNSGQRRDGLKFQVLSPALHPPNFDGHTIMLPVFGSEPVPNLNRTRTRTHVRFGVQQIPDFAEPVKSAYLDVLNASEL